MANLEAAKAFVNRWKSRGDEKQETQAFWIELLDKVYEDHDYMDHVLFEVVADKVEGGSNYKDVVINRGTDRSVLIEQKSSTLQLDKTEVRFGGKLVTPFQQAKHYDDLSAVNDKARWIITCNFKEFWIYDMTKTGKELYVPIAKMLLEDLPTHANWLNMITPKEKINPVFIDELAVSNEAGHLVGIMYDALKKRYGGSDSEETSRNLNRLCVRLVFCLYAEDAGLFDKNNRKVFHDYLERYDAQKIRKALIELFKVLNQKENERDEFLSEDDPLLATFPYVNGGLFEGDVKIPPFDEEIRELLLDRMSLGFDWSAISPTIFGAVFESTLNPETRRQGGMHYTSIENIHKVIDPLFFDDLRNELGEILKGKQPNVRERKLRNFQEKIASLKFMDPAAGSGNFLTESYLSLRKLENTVIRALMGNNTRAMELNADASQIMVSINQFYGIEINDFAVAVAKTALWIAEAQMFDKTQELLSSNRKFLPLHEYDNIKEGNALRMDWNDVIPASELNYIMGNPPFVGQAMRTKDQAREMNEVFNPSKAGGKLDYVAGWYKKASDYIKSTDIVVAFVSSNSICQGESVNLLWQLMLEEEKNYIDFAYRTFKWKSEASDQAGVSCVIVGFSQKDRSGKILYDEDGNKHLVKHINGYLNDGPDVYIANRSKSINKNMAKVVQGSPPADDGRLLMTASEKDDWLKKYPELKDVIHPFVGSREFINDITYSRYCFWFVDKNMSNYTHIKELMDRFEYIRQYRLASPVPRIQQTADKPFLFTQNRQPQSDYLIIPRVSSEKRRYIPVGFLPSNVIVSDSAVCVNNATLYDFGIICSNIHNSWMRTIAGRLESRYRYAPSVYYNFPFPEIDRIQKEKVEKTAQAILSARAKYPDASLADMYGEYMYLYPELLKAHQENDRAVMEAYGFRKDMTEAEIVAELMILYQKLADIQDH